MRFSSLVVEQRWIKEIDVNPLLVSEKGIAASDARVFLYGLDAAEDSIPGPAIRPYPAHVGRGSPTRAWRPQAAT